jgi:hypothetical protein
LNIHKFLVCRVGGSVDIDKATGRGLARLVLWEGNVTVLEVLDGDDVTSLGDQLRVCGFVGIDRRLSRRTDHLVGSNTSASSREADNHLWITEARSARDIAARIAWGTGKSTVGIDDIHLLNPGMSRDFANQGNTQRGELDVVLQHVELGNVVDSDRAVREMFRMPASKTERRVDE